TPCVANQDAAHQSGGHGEEVCPVLPLWIGLIGQAQISFVDKRRRLQCVIGTFSGHLTMGKALQFRIDKGGQFREGSIVALAPACQELGHSLRRNCWRIYHGLQSLSAQKCLCTNKASPKKT